MSEDGSASGVESGGPTAGQVAIQSDAAQQEDPTVGVDLPEGKQA